MALVIGRRLDLLVLNWTDNDLLDRRTRRVAWRKVAKLFARTLALRLAARRLAFVRHNVYPHATAAGGEAAATRWVDRYERLFDVVLTHSGAEVDGTRRYCPHPLYPRVDPPAASTRASRLPRDYVVAFGRIVRYKRLERLMAAFPARRTLVVAGAVGDRAYAAELAALARPNVICAPGMLDETDAQALVAGSRALVVAHADADVVVSSSLFYAWSLGVPVVAVATPFLRWIAPRVGDEALRIAPDVASLCAMARRAAAGWTVRTRRTRRSSASSARTRCATRSPRRSDGRRAAAGGGCPSDRSRPRPRDGRDRVARAATPAPRRRGRPA